MAEEHALSLSKLCRFCGIILTSYTQTIAEHNEKILKCFYIDVTKNNEHIHPRIQDRKKSQIFRTKTSLAVKRLSLAMFLA